MRTGQRLAEGVMPHARPRGPRRRSVLTTVARAGSPQYGRTMPSASPLNVVIAGGGIAAVEAVMALRDMAEDRVTITVLAPERDLELKPLRTAEPFSVDHVRRFPLADILARFDAQIRASGLAAVDADNHSVRLDDGSDLAYDALLLAVGARPRPAYEGVLTFGADPRTEALNDLLADLEGGYGSSVAFVV